jgi:hypothetical protein
MASSATSGSDRAQSQPWARAFVMPLLAAFLICGVLGIEAWPLSGFRLFSAPRGSISTGWRLVAVGPDGDEEAVGVWRLGAAYRGFGFVARSFPELSPADRAATCEAWLRATASIGIDAEALRLIIVEQPLVPRGEHGPLVEPTRTIVATCDGAPT